MYVYRTPQFNDKAERYGMQTRIDDLCAELETLRIDEVQAHFERVYPYLKRRTLNRRVVARILRVDDEQLLCLLDIFKRGDSDYEQFLEDPREYGRVYLEPQLDAQRLRDWLAAQKDKQPLNQQLPELPPELRPWLEPPGWEMETGTEDWVIYESEEWVKRFQKPEIEAAWETYYQIILRIKSKTIHSQEFPNLANVKLCALNDRYVLYSQLETPDTAIGGVLFLLAPFDRQPSTLEIIQVGEATALFNGTSSETETWGLGTEFGQSTFHSQSTVSYNFLARQLSLHDLTPFARRSYPAYLLADEESWLAIERGKEANLALSAEEERILKSVSTSALGNGSLPLFINGRAGSGKSTLLLYLFADYCYRKYYDKHGHRRVEPLLGEPLFLTYNERLLEVAKVGVKTLLSSHHRFVAERNQGDEMESIDRFFQPFQKFLLSLLPPAQRNHFDPEKYISFHRFKQLYQGKSPSESLAKVTLHLPEARRYSPETSWHVIRSFIKGYGFTEYMTPEDYQEEVPRKERTIDIEKFQGIYTSIWERWYKRITQEQGYWDDQDLIAKVLELKCYPSEYTAIFCDEAQDFTKLELQLIMRLSVFSRYHLGYQLIHSLPFAFAGDPFQTLNPTGFHWSSVQAIFDAEVITALDPAEQLKLIINFQELAFNYRSCPSIVQFTNLIQLWRHVLFNIHELQPQTAWQQGNFPEPQKFILRENITPEELRNHIQDTIIIVPCEEGEETAYAQADEVLSEIFPQLKSRQNEKIEPVPNPTSKIQNASSARGEFLNSAPQNPKSTEPLKNVLSAISAKGLEFKKVILYKFGEDCNRNVWNLRRKDADQIVKAEYFFNKLYVAASRATEHLFVVDSEQGDRQLWQYASDEALLQAMLRHARNRERWENSVRTISPATARTAQALREDDPDAIALEFETKGLNSQNPSLLRRARQFYNDLGNTAKANVCEAWALRFEEYFREAGNLFVQLGKADEAWDCFWQGMCWSELVTWYNQHPNRKTTERPLAMFMAAQLQDIEAIKNFTSFINEQWLGASLVLSSEDRTYQQNNQTRPYRNYPEKQRTQHKQQKKAIEEYANRIEAQLNNSAFKSDELQQFGTALEAVGVNSLAGKCFYRADNYEQAVRIWEASGATQTLEYNQAKAKLLGIPDGLEYLEKAGEHDRIIAEWKQAGQPRDRRWLQYVAPALETRHQYQQAFVVYVWLDELAKVKECFESASQEAVQIKLLTVLFQYLYRKKHWFNALEAIENYLPTVTSSEAQKVGLKFDIVYEIACSELSPDDLAKEHRKRYEKFFTTDILSTSDWQQYLSMQQVGIALEKVGSLLGTLGFYEHFISHSDPELRQFARERWIATKKRQQEYAKSQRQTDKASRHHSELLKKARNWSIPQQSIPLTPPAAPKERPTPPTPRETITRVSTTTPAKRSQLPTATKVAIQGLPSGTKIEHLEDGLVKFRVRHLVIKLIRQAKQVLITDTLNNREVRVDGTECKVMIGEASVEAVVGSPLTFTLFTSGYKGSLVYNDKNPRLELNVEGLSEKISIDL